MINGKMKIGDTLSQRGLALRAEYDVSTIRKKGRIFKVYVRGNRTAWRETWERLETGGYALREIEG